MAKRTAKKKKKRSARRKATGRGRPAATAGRKKTTRKARGRGRPPALSSVPMEKLEQEIERRQSQLGELYKQRERLAGQLADLDALIVAEGGDPGAAPARRGPGRPRGSGARRASTGRAGSRGGGSGRRARNDISLVDALQQVLSGQQLSVSEAADAVKALGYRSNAASFKTIVNQTLIKHPDKFKKVDRGVYTTA